MTQGKAGWTFLKFDLPDSLRTEFITACAAHGMSQSAMMRYLITWWLEDLREKKESP